MFLVGGTESLPVGDLSGFNDSKEFSNSQKWMIFFTTIVIHKRLWKSNDLSLIHSLWIEYNLGNQSHSMADINAACQQVSWGFFLLFYFYFHIGDTLQG